MRDILTWALAFRWRIVLLSVGLAISPLTAPLASALLVLCALAQSPRLAILSAGIASVVLVILAIVGGGQAWSAPATLVGWTLVIGMATLVRRSGSLSLAVQLASLVALLSIVVWNLLLRDPGSVFEPLVMGLLQPLVSQGNLQADSAVVRQIAELMPGIMVVSIFATLIVSLAIGRHWHGLLTGQQKFATEFRQYRLGRIVGLIATAGLLAGFLFDGPGAANLMVVAGAVFFVQGLAVAHALVKVSGLGFMPLMVLYAAMIFAAQLAIPLVLAAGLVDNWLDLRGKLISRK